MDTQKLLKKHWKIILALLYLVFPIDIIPDVLLPIGAADDILVLFIAIIDYLRKNKNNSNDKQSNKKDNIVEGEIVEE